MIFKVLISLLVVIVLAWQGTLLAKDLIKKVKSKLDNKDDDKAIDKDS